MPITAKKPADTPRRGQDTKDRIRAVLTDHPDGITVAAIADTTGLGTSTISKTLAVWETDGHAIRTPGGRDGTRRIPDTWTPPPNPTDDRIKHPTDDKTADPATPPQSHNGDTATTSTTSGAGHTGRLGKGQLNDLILRYLIEHPNHDGWSPSAISKAITRSSGAIANALERMTTTGQVTRTSDKPRRYQHT